MVHCFLPVLEFGIMYITVLRLLFYVTCFQGELTYFTFLIRICHQHVTCFKLRRTQRAHFCTDFLKVKLNFIFLVCCSLTCGCFIASQAFPFLFREGLALQPGEIPSVCHHAQLCLWCLYGTDLVETQQSLLVSCHPLHLSTYLYLN